MQKQIQQWEDKQTENRVEEQGGDGQLHRTPDLIPRSNPVYISEYEYYPNNNGSCGKAFLNISHLHFSQIPDFFFCSSFS